MLGILIWSTWCFEAIFYLRHAYAHPSHCRICQTNKTPFLTTFYTKRRDVLLPDSKDKLLPFGHFPTSPHFPRPPLNTPNRQLYIVYNRSNEDARHATHLTRPGRIFSAAIKTHEISPINTTSHKRASHVVVLYTPSK